MAKYGTVKYGQAVYGAATNYEKTLTASIVAMPQNVRRTGRFSTGEIVIISTVSRAANIIKMLSCLVFVSSALEHLFVIIKEVTAAVSVGGSFVKSAIKQIVSEVTASLSFVRAIGKWLVVKISANGILDLINGICYGLSTQNSTPTPDAPVSIINEIEAGSYQYVSDGCLYEVSLPAMRSVGTVKDTYDTATGQFTRRIGVKMFDGTESFAAVLSSGVTYYGILKTSIDSNSNMTAGQVNILCTHFPVLVWSAPIGGMWIGGSYLLFNYDNGVGGVSSFQSYLAAQYAAGTPVTVYYQLATPVTSTITPTLVADTTTKEVQKGITATADGYGSLLKNITYAKIVSGMLFVAGTVSKGIGKLLSGISVTTGYTVKGLGKMLAGVITATVSKTKGIAKFVLGRITAQGVREYLLNKKYLKPLLAIISKATHKATVKAPVLSVVNDDLSFGVSVEKPEIVCEVEHNEYKAVVIK